jgi:subtilase family serine protease
MNVLRLCLVLTISALPVGAQTRPIISGQIDNSIRTTISHSAHPLARPEFESGRVESDLEMRRMILVLTSGPELDRQLLIFLDSQQTTGSPNYHRWVTPDEFGRTFGPSPNDLLQIKTWLEQQGFIIASIARGGRWIEFSGSAQQVERAFQTQMHRYVVDGITHIANATDVSIPSALAPVILGVLSLNDFFRNQRPRTPLMSQSRSQATRSDSPDVALTNFNALGPGDFAAIYNVAPLYRANENGNGTTIGIVAASDVRISDIETFRTIFSLPANNPAIILNGVDPGFIYTQSENYAQEATFDAEWAGAIAPNATIDLVVSAEAETTPGWDLSAAYIVDSNLDSILSESFGDCENTMKIRDTFYNYLWQQAAAQGISVFVSAGDGGAAGCADFRETSGPPEGAQAIKAVSGIASSPFDTAVGGTEFNEKGNDSVFWSANPGPGFANAVGYIPEMVWNQSCDPTVTPTCPKNQFSLLAGGGGVSTIYPKPSWQSLSVTGVPNDLMRDLPDISLSAASHDGYIFCFSGEASSSCSYRLGNTGTVTGFSNAGTFHGTSASAPSFAGIMAIIDQKMGGRQGLANYVLYQLASVENFTACNSSSMTNPEVVSECIFYDITDGDNSIPGVTGHSATTGYDLASGLGSVNAANLVNAWSTVANGTVTPPFQLLATIRSKTITAGQTATYSVILQGNNGFTGIVSLGCSVPIKTNCSVGPNSVSLSPSSTSSVISVSVSPIAEANSPKIYNLVILRQGPFVLAAILMTFPLFKKRRRAVLVSLVFLLPVVTICGCSTQKKTATYVFSVIATSGVATNRIPLTFTVTQ